MPRSSLLFPLIFATLVLPFYAADAQAPLQPVARFSMPGGVQGKFDHLGIDEKGRRLFVAAESAHEVLVFDLHSGKYLRAITNIEIPHAVFVSQDLNRIYVTDGGAGAVKVFDGRTYALMQSIPLKVDSDSIGYDPATHYLYVDNGGGDAHESFSMLSVVDTARDAKVADIRIDGDTLEAMALEKNTPRMYVNDPALNQVVVLDRQDRSILATWPVKLGKHNVAMALDEVDHRLFVASRSGAISVFDTNGQQELSSLAIGPGVDDLAFDAANKRIYAACGGDGLIYVYQKDSGDKYTLVGKVPTGPGGKNALLSASLGRFYVIVPPGGGTPGSVIAYSMP